MGERDGLTGVDHAAVRGSRPDSVHLGNELDGSLVNAAFFGVW